MDEEQYIVVSDLRTVRIAREILRGLLPSYYPEIIEVHRTLARIEENLYARVTAMMEED